LQFIEGNHNAYELYFFKPWHVGSCGCCLLVLQLAFSLSHEIPFSRPPPSTSSLFFQLNFYVYSFFRKTFLQIVLARFGFFLVWFGSSGRSAAEIDRNAAGCSVDWNNGMAESYVGTFICFDCLYKIFYGKMCKVILMQLLGRWRSSKKKILPMLY